MKVIVFLLGILVLSTLAPVWIFIPIRETGTLTVANVTEHVIERNVYYKPPRTSYRPYLYFVSLDCRASATDSEFSKSSDALEYVVERYPIGSQQDVYVMSGGCSLSEHSYRSLLGLIILSIVICAIGLLIILLSIRLTSNTV